MKPPRARRLCGRIHTVFSCLPVLVSALAAHPPDRGVVAVPRSDGSVFVSWRLLANDRPDLAFDVWRIAPEGGEASQLNLAPLRDGCHFVDTEAAGQSWIYRVQPAPSTGKPDSTRGEARLAAGIGYVRIPLQGPYRAQKVGLADFDGDGRLDYLVKHPDFNTDPYQQPGYWKRSEDTYKLEAYRHDGQFLWRYDMGWAIEAGIWYSLGSTVLDDNGSPLWSTFKGHPDLCYVADVDPARPGLEVFYGLETRQRSNAVCVVEGRTGKVLWGCPEPTVHVHGQGMLGDIIPEHPGMELYAGEAKGGTNYWLYTATGQRLSDQSLGELSPKAIYWLEGATKVFLVGNTLYRWPRVEIGKLEGRLVAVADCLGDWREEVITALEGELRVYTTTVATSRRRPWLMQDRLYRNDVAVQTMGYFHPPQLAGPLFP